MRGGKRLYGTAVTVAVDLCLSGCYNIGMSEKRPNIVVFFTDQQRWDTVSERVTPNLCAMAESGTEFEYSFTCQPVCGPARACIQTGVYATENGCITNAVAMKEDATTIAKILREYGYLTAYVGKWHLASGMTDEQGRYETTAIPQARRGGYEYWRASDVLEFTSDGSGGYVFDENGNKLEFSGCRADKITDFALEFIENAPEDRPFFLFLSHIEPHHQNSTGRFECTPEDRAAVEGVPVPDDLAAFEGNYAGNYTDYLGCCHGLDRNFGRVADALKKKGVYDDTVIFFTSDHGCHFMTRNSEYKRSCHDSSIRTPLYVFGGKYPKGKKCEGSRRAYRSSVLRTVRRGDRASVVFQGKGSCEDRSRGRREGRALHTDKRRQTGQSGAYRSLRLRGEVARKKDGWNKAYSDVYIEDYLYDTAKDPCETRNLIRDPSYRGVKRDLAERLEDSRRRRASRRSS